ncbi:MAG: T9SS type A sorting domain-containing protein [Bacteroidota bacterium]|jgi:hypothetical protein
MIPQYTSLVARTTTALSALTCLIFLSGTAFGQCGELVVNGNFETGNTGFTSQYIYTPAPAGIPPTQTLDQSRYDVLSDPTYTHQCFGGVDHTSGTGKAMMVNASINPGRIVWSQNVSVLTGTNYRLSAWVNSQCFGINPAILRFSVNGVPVGAPFVAPSSAFNWVKFMGVWNSGVATSATIEIVDLNVAGSGNDFGLDDISFMKIDETAPVLETATAQSMWPPNHSYHTFDLSGIISSVSDDCDGSPMVYISGAGSDEAENAPGDGDGDTSDDIVIAPDCQSVQLRSERQGAGNGRVYTIYISATDYSGNTSTVEYKVSVKHSVRTAATDDGVSAGYAIASACGVPKTIAASSAPNTFTLEQNFPNPFNPSTVIRYSIAEETDLRLTVLDHLGREVSVLVDGAVAAGSHSVSFNATELPSGIYFYRLDSPRGSMTKKMMLMK